MLKKSKRIHSQEFALLPKGVIKNTPYFDIRISPNETLKVACIVSKKNFKTAVRRNKIRRKMYAILEETLEKKNGYYIIYPKQQAINIPHSTLIALVTSVI